MLWLHLLRANLQVLPCGSTVLFVPWLSLLRGSWGAIWEKWNMHTIWNNFSVNAILISEMNHLILEVEGFVRPRRKCMHCNNSDEFRTWQCTPKRSISFRHNCLHLFQTSHNWKPPKSPFQLIEEIYWQNPWKLLVSCMVVLRIIWRIFGWWLIYQLLNKTSGKQVRKIIDALFEKFPTAQDLEFASPEDLESIIKPL